MERKIFRLILPAVYTYNTLQYEWIVNLPSERVVKACVKLQCVKACWQLGWKRHEQEHNKTGYWKTGKIYITCKFPILLSSLGIMGSQLRAPLKPLDNLECCDVSRGSRGAGIGLWETPAPRKAVRKWGVVFPGGFWLAINYRSNAATAWALMFLMFTVIDNVNIINVNV